MDHPVVIEVGREGHSKRQFNEITVSRDEGEQNSAGNKSCAHVYAVSTWSVAAYPTELPHDLLELSTPAPLGSLLQSPCNAGAPLVPFMSLPGCCPKVQEQVKRNHVRTLQNKYFWRSFLRWHLNYDYAKLSVFFLLYVYFALQVEFWDKQQHF